MKDIKKLMFEDILNCLVHL